MRLADLLYKSAAYLSLPFVYRDRFFSLLRSVIFKRTLTSELMRLTKHRTWFEKADIRTVIDIGAYLGAFAFAMRTIVPDVNIYSFEPLEDLFQKLLENNQRYERFQAYHTALGSSSGTMKFWRNDFTAASSLLSMAESHKQAFPHTASSTEVQVDVNRLDDFLPKLKIQKNTLLKLDIQGYELEALRGAQDTLKRVDYILIEVSFKPLYEGQPLFAEVYEYISRRGFIYMGSMDPILSPIDGSILQTDAFFIKEGT